MTKANLVELNQDPLHQRLAVTTQHRKVHDKKRVDPLALTRKESNLRQALKRMAIKPIEYEHELPTDPPAWIDALVRVDGQLWYIDCSPFYPGRRPLEERKKAILRRKQLYAKKYGTPFVLVAGSVIEMIGTLEIERFRQKARGG